MRKMPQPASAQQMTCRMRHTGGTVRFDKEVECTHEQICTDSYTSERLNWVFDNRKKTIKAYNCLNQSGGCISRHILHLLYAFKLTYYINPFLEVISQRE